MNEAIHLHVQLKGDNDLIILSKTHKGMIKLSSLKFANLNGSTRGIVKFYSFADMKERTRKQEPTLNLQASNYNSSGIRKIKEKLVFNGFRIFDESLKSFYETKKAEIAKLEEEIKQEIENRFMELPFLDWEVVKGNIEYHSEQSKETLQKIMKELKINYDDCGVEE